MSIDTYLTDLGHVRDQYQRYWVNPYGSCYSQAYDKYKQTLADQAKLDQLKMQCLMLVASVAFGGGMSALFGTAVVRSLAVSGALHVVCSRNMNRLFSAMAWVEQSPAASFIAQHAWDGVAGILTSQTTSRITGLATNRPDVRQIVNPHVFQNKLQNYVLDCKLAADRIGEEVRDSRVLRETARNEYADQLRAAPFFANAPTQSLVPDPERTRKEMELLLYMVVVMNSDYLVETEYASITTGSGTRMDPVSSHATSIARSPNDPRYPRASRGAPGGVYTTQQVEYRRPGGSFWSAIMDRTNDLHRELFGTDFQRGGYGRDEITRAEGLSRRIQGRYYSIPA